MDYIGIEESYLTCYKFLDGAGIPASASSGVGCDLSFNDGVTAGYMLSRCGFSNVYLPFWNGAYVPGLISVDMSSGLINGLRGVLCDYVISVGGTFKFIPADETACAVFKSLNAGGRFLFGVFPWLFDDNGADLLALYSKESGLNVNKKLLRWSQALRISFGRYFPETEVSTLITDTTADEVRDFFRANSICNFLCSSEDEFDAFFGRLDDSSRLYMFWQVLSGEKR